MKISARMSGGLKSCWHQIMRSESGAAAPMIAAALIPTFAAVGAAIDTGYAIMAKSQLSAAADAAALAGGRSFDEPGREAIVRRYFKANFSDQRSTVVKNPHISVNFTDTDGVQSVEVTATSDVKTFFMGFFGYNKIDISTTAIARREVSPIEMVMVLDNTESMKAPAGGGKTRIEALRDAASDLVTTLYGDTTSNDNLYLGVIPYTSFVNVGGLLQAEQAALGKTYLENLPGFTLSQTDPLGWKGCVDADQTINTIGAGSDANSAADFAGAWDTMDYEPGASGNPLIRPAHFPSWRQWVTHTNSGIDRNCVVTGTNRYWFEQPGRWECTSWSEGSCINEVWRDAIAEWREHDIQECTDIPGTEWTVTNTWLENDRSYFPFHSFNDSRVGLVGDYRVPATGDVPAPQAARVYPAWDSGTYVKGGDRSPNMYCPAPALKVDKHDKQDMLDYLNNNLFAYEPGWGTMSNQGLVWAYRMLTPELPFAGMPASARHEKAIILMTDGFLWAPMETRDARTPYGFLTGFFDDQRLVGGSGPRWTESYNAMERRLRRLCKVVKDQNITIYTVTFGMPGSDWRKELYESCASSPDLYFDAVDTQALTDAFEKIGNDLLSLRLVK